MSTNRILALIIGLLSLVYILAAYQIPVFPIPRPVDSDALPKLLGLLMLGLAVWLFFERPQAAEAAEEDAPETAKPGAFAKWLPVVITAVAIAAYATVLSTFGFVLASFLLTFGLTWQYGYRRHGLNAAVALAVPLGLYLAMTRLMDIHLPRGILPF